MNQNQMNIVMANLIHNIIQHQQQQQEAQQHLANLPHPVARPHFFPPVPEPRVPPLRRELTPEPEPPPAPRRSKRVRDRKISQVRG